jgi:hypothetical protein
MAGAISAAANAGLGAAPKEASTPVALGRGLRTSMEESVGGGKGGDAIVKCNPEGWASDGGEELGVQGQERLQCCVCVSHVGEDLLFLWRGRVELEGRLKS